MRGILWLSEVTEQVLKLELAAVLTGYYSLCVGYKHHSYRHRTSCRVVGCTWGDTCISGHSLCPHRCADSLRCHGYMLLWLHETRQHYITACFAGVNRCCVCVCVYVSAACCFAHTDTVSLVPGQLEPRTTLAGHAPFGCLFADVGTAMLLIHTVEALWGRKRVRGTHWNSPTVAGRQHTKPHTLRV